MEITIDELLKGKGTKIKNKEYLPTASYVEPFLDRMSKYTDDFIVKVKLPDQITTLDNMEDITYNRVWIQAVMPEQDTMFENHQEVVGFLYGLDVRKPVAKIYRGALNMACTNLCVFSPSFLNTQDLEPDTALTYRPVQEIMEQTNDIRIWLEKLANTTFGRDKVSIERELGRWSYNSIIRSYDSGYGKVKIANSLPIDAFKQLFIEKDSPYFIPEDRSEVDMFTVYNSFTELITNDKDKDIMNKVEKTLLLKNILEVC